MAFQTTAGRHQPVAALIAGIGIGVELVTVDTFISELVPKRARGKTFAIQQSIGFIPVPLVALLAWLLNPTTPFGLSGWRWVVIIGSVGAIIVWFVRLRLPESPRWLAQQGRVDQADQVMRSIEAKVAAQSGGTLPDLEPPVVEDPRRGRLVEIFNPTYRSRTIMLSVANFFQTVGFYGFANWVPTLLIAKGIHVSQTLEYSFIIAFAYPLFPLVSSLFADRIERKWQVCLSCIGLAVFGLAFSFQTEAVPLIIIGTLQTMMNAWLSFSIHNYQSEVFPTRVRARGYRVRLFVEPVQRDLHGVCDRRDPAALRRPGGVPVHRQRHGRCRPVDCDIRTAHQPPFAGGYRSPRPTRSGTATRSDRLSLSA